MLHEKLTERILKAVKDLAPEHQAQVINYLKATDEKRWGDGVLARKKGPGF